MAACCELNTCGIERNTWATAGGGMMVRTRIGQTDVSLYDWSDEDACRGGLPLGHAKSYGACREFYDDGPINLVDYGDGRGEDFEE